jgi:hypothetical protein
MTTRLLTAALITAWLALPGWAQSNALKASVVLRAIEDGNTSSVGSGTIIDAQEDDALILTVGHIFKDVDPKAEIRVALYGGKVVKGRIVHSSQNPDIALVAVTGVPPAVAPVAKLNPRKGAKLSRVGMFGEYEGTLASLNRFEGAANLCMTGCPAQGDSGGGVFNDRGEVVGIISCMDQAEDQTIATGLHSIHHELASIVGIKETGCRWVQDESGRWIKICDSKPSPPPRDPPPAAPPANPPVKNPPPMPPPGCDCKEKWDAQDKVNAGSAELAIIVANQSKLIANLEAQLSAQANAINKVEQNVSVVQNATAPPTPTFPTPEEIAAKLTHSAEWTRLDGRVEKQTRPLNEPLKFQSERVGIR